MNRLTSALPTHFLNAISAFISKNIIDRVYEVMQRVTFTQHSPVELTDPAKQQSHKEAVETVVLADGTLFFVPARAGKSHSSTATPPGTPLPPHHYLIASLVFTATSGLLSLMSLAVAAEVVRRRCSNSSPNEVISLARKYVVVLYSMVVVESCLCFVTMMVCFYLLRKKPYRILIGNPSSCSHTYLCACIVSLFLFSIYSIAVHLVSPRWDPLFVPPASLSFIPSCRAVALLAFFVVLVSSSRLASRQPLL
ncbi:hypothetical protein ABL78_4256 [Leptomonas seymouri]|uniref:Uncharacterized protein n=1 Tax=Leptomonas seymouri TaxID=5684 RepID=A0A0N1PDA0_LEPSE|nr:hypothetical protein ABL78_4256 [Leptomonas seymouri]|eukprot:KPI86698.1 hypothetical protein ABL78_4256 [Leptomonas seymouri]